MWMILDTVFRFSKQYIYLLCYLLSVWSHLSICINVDLFTEYFFGGVWFFSACWNSSSMSVQGKWNYAGSWCLPCRGCHWGILTIHLDHWEEQEEKDEAEKTVNSIWKNNLVLMRHHAWQNIHLKEFQQWWFYAYQKYVLFKNTNSN